MHLPHFERNYLSELFVLSSLIGHGWPLSFLVFDRVRGAFNWTGHIHNSHGQFHRDEVVNVGDGGNALSRVRAIRRTCIYVLNSS